MSLVPGPWSNPCPRDLTCFNYFCHGCWEHQHAGRTQHKPLMRNIRGLTRARAGHGNMPPDLGRKSAASLSILKIILS